MMLVDQFAVFDRRQRGYMVNHFRTRQGDSTVSVFETACGHALKEGEGGVFLMGRKPQKILKRKW